MNVQQKVAEFSLSASSVPGPGPDMGDPEEEPLLLPSRIWQLETETRS